MWKASPLSKLLISHINIIIHSVTESVYISMYRTNVLNRLLHYSTLESVWNGLLCLYLEVELIVFVKCSFAYCCFN